MKVPFRNYEIVYGEIERNGISYPAAMAIKQTPKGRFKTKVEWNFRFRSEDHRSEYIAKWKANIERYAKMKEDEKEQKRQFRANLVNPFKVGDLLYDSWGWEQTNIDYFEVVSVGNKSVEIAPIGQNYVRGTGFMSETVSPKKGDFQGDPIKRILQVDGKGIAHIPSPRRSGAGWLHSTSEGEENYQSHYA